MKLKSPDKGTVSTIPTDVSVVKLGFIMQKQKAYTSFCKASVPNSLQPLRPLQLLFFYK